MTTPFETAPYPRIALVLGKPIRRNRILAGVLELLVASPAAVEIHLPASAPPPP